MSKSTLRTAHKLCYNFFITFMQFFQFLFYSFWGQFIGNFPSLKGGTNMFEMMHPVMSNYATLLCCGIEKRLSAGFVGCTKASYFSEVECVTKLVGFVACLLFLLLVWLICTPPSPIQKKMVRGCVEVFIAVACL